MIGLVMLIERKNKQTPGERFSCLDFFFNLLRLSLLRFFLTKNILPQLRGGFFLSVSPATPFLSALQEALRYCHFIFLEYCDTEYLLFPEHPPISI